MDVITKLITGVLKNKHCPIQPKSDQFMVSHGYRNPLVRELDFQKTKEEKELGKEVIRKWKKNL